MSRPRQTLSHFKFVNHLDRLQRLAEGESPATIPPVTVEIDPTNVCNSACWWCSTQDLRQRTRKSLDRERVLVLLQELQQFGVRSVVFKGGGDPTMVGWIDEAVERAKTLGLGVGLNTNGARMTDQLHAALVAHGSWVRFSVDAASYETYRKVHRTNEWERVVANISELVRRRACSESALQIGINHNLDQYNIGEVPLMISQAREWGVDYVSIRPVYWNIAPEEARTEAQDLRTRVAAALEEARGLIRESDSMEVKIGNIRNAVGHDIDDPGDCLAPALVGIVGADGEVAPCCDLRGHAQYSFGNIYEQSFVEIWGSSRRLEVLRRHTACRECDPHCSHAYAYYNQVIDYMRSPRPQKEFM